MARKSGRKRQRRRVTTASRFNISYFLSNDRNRKIFRLGGWTMVVAMAGTGVVVAATRTETYVRRELARTNTTPTLSFTNLPEPLESLALHDLTTSTADLLERDWTDDRICKDLAVRLAEVGWIAKVSTVRRMSQARFEVEAEYRVPVAMVSEQGGFGLVSADAVRLPGTHRFDPAWMIIQGVEQPAPEPGSHWAGNDLRAALDMVSLLAVEPYAAQLTAVLVDNFQSPRRAGRCPIELATDRAGGRIRWGSAPGTELAENSVDEKLAILRENFRSTGRVDAGYAVIDVSILPDRFTIPG